MISFSQGQKKRLTELGADKGLVDSFFENVECRDIKFQDLEKKLVNSLHKRLDDFFSSSRRPRILELEEKLARALRAINFVQVHTPMIISRSRLEKMGIFEGGIMEKQIFWLDANHCLRPMLAPNLYEYMRDLGKLRDRPLRLFEIGPCFRRETDGNRHANEFTMLNLVEMGLPADEIPEERILKLGEYILNMARIKEWTLITDSSSVYGKTFDFIDKNNLELASCAIGPHPLDKAWNITDNWVGLGFGLERLVMSASSENTLSRTGRSITYLDGIRMHL